MERVSGLALLRVEAVRHAIASAFLANETEARAPRVGAIELKPHQTEAASRIRSAIAEFGGALLCDPVGTGKTFVALALASGYRRTLVIAPAVLREMWHDAARAARASISFASHESLSRRETHSASYDFVIVDEAHHARNPATRRFQAISQIVSDADVVLLTATPIHNRRRDAETLLSLFLGSRAPGLTQSELARCVVRRETSLADTASGMPRVAPLAWIETLDDEAIAQAIIELPPPLPTRGGGDGGALVSHALLRLWASSDAALLAGLARRLNRAAALAAALESGTYPSREDLSAWTAVEDSVQLAFAEIMAPACDDARSMLEAVRVHADAVRRLIGAISQRTHRDDATARALRMIRSHHRGVPVVAFSQYHDTVERMFRLLAPGGRVAALTGRAGIVSGGRISRREIVARLAPSTRTRVGAAQAIDLLIASDLLSEGVNLQEAGVVVHLDLPWTPARMEQRLGRIARLGSNHNLVHSYAVHPPASSESLVRLESILEGKLRSAAMLVGSFPALGRRAARESSNPEIAEEIREIMGRWTTGGAPLPESGIPVANVVCAVQGFIAVCRHHGRTWMLVSEDDRISDSPSAVLRALRLAGGESVPVDHALALVAVDTIILHVSAANALAGIRVHSTSRRHALARLGRVVRTSRPHERAVVAALAARARAILLGQLGSHAEHQLASRMLRDLPDAEWLAAITDLAGSRLDATAHADSPGVTISGILLLTRQPVNALSRARER